MGTVRTHPKCDSPAARSGAIHSTRPKKLQRILCGEIPSLFQNSDKFPYRFIVPLPIREEELLDFTPQEWRMLEDGGFTTYDLPGEEVAQVFALKREHSRLSANDCFALLTATCQEKGILLTGDAQLRKVATTRDVRVHGVLWIIDDLHAADACEAELLISALEVWRNEPTVFLPDAEMKNDCEHFDDCEIEQDEFTSRYVIGTKATQTV